MAMLDQYDSKICEFMIERYEECFGSIGRSEIKEEVIDKKEWEDILEKR